MKPFRPESFLVNATVAKTITRLTPEECKRWLVDTVRSFESFLTDRDHEPEFDDSLLGDLTKQEWNTLRGGLISLLKQYEANPSGKPKSETPTGTPSGTPSGRAKSTQYIHSSNKKHTTSMEQPVLTQEGKLVRDAAQLARSFEINGFQYRGETSLQDVLLEKMKEGYSMEDMINAFHPLMSELQKGKAIHDHLSYFLEILSRQNPYGAEGRK